MNTNETVIVVGQAVYWTVYEPVHGAVDRTVTDAVYAAVSGAVYWAASGAVYDAVGWAAAHAPLHPALPDLMSGYADRGAP